MESSRIVAIVFVILAVGAVALALNWSPDRSSVPDSAVVEPGSLLLFTQAGCPPCRDLESMLHSDTVHEFLKQTEVKITEIDTRKHQDLVRKFRVEYTPTLVMLDAKGRQRATVSGAMNAMDFMDWVRANR